MSTTNDVRPSITRQVSYEARVDTDLPATGADAEVVDDGSRWRERPIAIVATDEDMLLAEPNDVEKSVSCNIGEETKMTVEAPTTGVVTKVV
jgi:hypothetical protein